MEGNCVHKPWKTSALCPCVSVCISLAIFTLLKHYFLYYKEMVRRHRKMHFICSLSFFWALVMQKLVNFMLWTMWTSCCVESACLHFPTIPHILFRHQSGICLSISYHLLFISISLFCVVPILLHTYIHVYIICFTFVIIYFVYYCVYYLSHWHCASS